MATVLQHPHKQNWDNPEEIHSVCSGETWLEWWPTYTSRCLLISLETLERRRINAGIFFVSDLLGGTIDCPELHMLFEFSNVPHNLRQKPYLRPTSHRTNYGYNSSLNRMIRMFNLVAHIYLDSNNRNCFRTNIKLLTHLNKNLSTPEWLMRLILPRNTDQSLLNQRLRLCFSCQFPIEEMVTLYYLM